MKTGTNLRRIITTILQIFFAILLIIYLIINTRVDVIRSQLAFTTISYDDFDSLPPPAFSLCSDDIPYNFNCTIYGNTTNNCPLIKFVNVSDDSTYNSWFTGCYVFHTSSPLLLAKPEVPTKDWSAFHSALFIRYSYFNNSKMQLMIWNSFDLKSSNDELSSKTILNPYLLNRYEPCRERFYTFRYKRHIFLNGTEKWDMSYRSELFGTKASTTGVIHFKPESFQVETTREHQLLPTISVITTFIILLAVLYTTYYSCLGGPGRYRTTGLAHMITRYYPQQHMKPPSDNSNSLKPSAEDILKVYLIDVDKSNFENK